MASVLCIPPNVPFLDALAGGLLEEGEALLSRTLVLLPSRRACLALRDTFLRVADGRPLLLPRLQPIGEPDETALLLEPALELDLPPAINPLRRRLLLTRLVLARGGIAHEQAIRLAGELEAFLDELQTEEVGLEAIDRLVPDELAEHWQETLRFLALLRESWPGLLAAEGAMEPLVRRNRLLAAVARCWSERPPSYPIVAAGTIGSIPAVARLLAVVARLPQGRVVLPGLDGVLDDHSWSEVRPSHPQWGLTRLLDLMQVDRAAVTPWPHLPPGAPPERDELLREVMRPAETSETWRTRPPVSPAAVRGVTVVEAPDLATEALHVALRLREAAETPGKRAVLVTPDRNLSRRVAAELLRWDIEVDDSAGVPLDQSPPGTFLLLTAHLVVDGAPPVTLLSALKHPLASGGLPQGTFRRHVRALERGLLRGPRIAGGLMGLVAALRERDASEPWPAPVPPEELLAWLEDLVAKAGPFTALAAREQAPFTELLEAHLAFAEALAADETGDASELWAKETGACAHHFIGELQAAGAVLEDAPTSAYPALLAVLMGTKTVRPRRSAHPRLAILGQLESRLAQADLVVVGGLVEGCWPRICDSGPWLNREMRRRIGLPPVEQEIGIAGHDLLMCAGAPEVVLTRAAKDEAAAPNTPSRWLARLAAVLRVAGVDGSVAPDPAWVAWTERLDAPEGPVTPCRRPMPRPPLFARPRQLTAADVERLMRDPYAVYAERVLRLKPLEPLNADAGAAERGQVVHAALDAFVRRWPVELPNDPLSVLLEIGEQLFAPLAHRPQVRSIWWPRFVQIARWFVEQELERRRKVARIITEIRGTLDLQTSAGVIQIRARADRVEIGHDGSLAILRYKTGRAPSAADVVQGIAPQLPIEGLIALAGGFPSLAACRPCELAVWRLKGGDPAGETIDPGRRHDLGAMLESARDGLARLLAHFDDPETAYVPVPRPEIAPGHNSYEHLARIDEWWGTEGAA